MLKRNDMMVAQMLLDKDIYVLGAIIKPVWSDGEVTDKKCIELHCVVLLDGLDFQYFRFKYDYSDNNIKFLNNLKTKGTLKVADVPGFDINSLFNYREQYFGQNMVSIGDVK